MEQFDSIDADIVQIIEGQGGSVQNGIVVFPEGTIQTVLSHQTVTLERREWTLPDGTELITAEYILVKDNRLSKK